MPRKMSKSDRASPGGSTARIHLADAALGVGVGAFLFAPDRGGQHQVREFGGRRGMKAVLHDQEVEVSTAPAAARPGWETRRAGWWR